MRYLPYKNILIFTLLLKRLGILKPFMISTVVKLNYIYIFFIICKEKLLCLSFKIIDLDYYKSMIYFKKQYINTKEHEKYFKNSNFSFKINQQK